MAGEGPFDFWLKEIGVVVEVDGEGHGVLGREHHGAEAGHQTMIDRRKEKAAVAAGLHVARLFYTDFLWWDKTILAAVQAARTCIAPRVHYTPSYPRLLTL